MIRNFLFSGGAIEIARKLVDGVFDLAQLGSNRAGTGESFANGIQYRAPNPSAAVGNKRNF